MNAIRETDINGAFAIALCGHIDSANAAEAEVAIDALLQKNADPEIILDADALSYISSAGLRILLRVMKSGRKLKMINASSDVFEIMETTGFSEMMSVQKAYRRVSIDGCEIIGKGANGTVFRLDEETIVKVYNDANALEEMNREREIARRVFILGIPTAIPYDIVRVGDTCGTVFELLNASSISRLLAKNPQNMDQYAGMFVELLKQIHATEAKPGDLPDMKAVAAEWARALDGHIPDELFARLCAMIQAVPQDMHLVHGDYHSNNVMVQNGETLLIDMDTMCCGHPVFEFASVFNAFVGFGELDASVIMRFLKIPYDLSIAFYEKVIRLYFNTEDEAELQPYRDRAMVLGYARLLRRILRHGSNTEADLRHIEYYKARLCELLRRVDTLCD